MFDYVVLTALKMLINHYQQSVLCNVPLNPELSWLIAIMSSFFFELSSCVFP